MNTHAFQVAHRRARVLPFEEFAEEYSYENPDDESNQYNPYRFNGEVQLYNPIYSLFESPNEITNEILPSISLNHRYAMIRPNTVLDQENGIELDRPIFTKFSPLLDPMKYLIGTYPMTDPSLRTLPTTTNQTECFSKIANVNNVSYIDSFFSFLSSKLIQPHNMLHAIDYYGSFLGIQRVFKINISDDIDYLNGSSFFMNHIGDEFTIGSSFHNEFANYGSRKNKQRIHIRSHRNQTESSHISLGAEEIDSIADSSLDTTVTARIDAPTEVVYAKQKDAHLVENPNMMDSASSNDDISTVASSDSELNYSSDEDAGDSMSDEDECDGASASMRERGDAQKNEDSSNESEGDMESDLDSEDTPVYAYIMNYPVQMICLEKCEGTLDQLFENGEIDEEHGSAYLMQIVMSLIIYQKAFRMTHNDLHTNNIMYVSTPFDYIYYCYQSKYYRVPTYGKIMKIIDFGRSIYEYRGKLFCSDSFAPGGDADTQYNTEPYYNPDKPRIDPNYSFDLCRLGCSIYDFVIDEEGEQDPDSLDKFQKTIVRWCLDDNRKNVLYKKNGDERYPNFKLYKMIARNVHKHTPQSQLKYPVFKQYEISGETMRDTIPSMSVIRQQGINIDEIPDYTV